MSTDKGESGEKGWFDDLTDVNGEPVPAIAGSAAPYSERPARPGEEGGSPRGGEHRAGEPWTRQDAERSWHRLAWTLVALIATSLVLGLTCAVWLADRAFAQLDQTEHTIVNLVNSTQASSQAFAVSQTDARAAYVSSQTLLNQSEAQKDREQAQLDRSLIALTKAEEATQRADAQLAYAEARLDEARARQLPNSGDASTTPRSDTAREASTARQASTAQRAETALLSADSQLSQALAGLAAAQVTLQHAAAHPNPELAGAMRKLVMAEADARRAATRLTTAQAAALSATDTLTSDVAARAR